MKTNKSLIEIEQGKEGVVIAVRGGKSFCQRLSGMCIRPGTKIRKISRSFLGGPITIQIGNARAALGFRMASKIIVEVDEIISQ
jgi:Fe2+ transport system protein FeoA